MKAKTVLTISLLLTALAFVEMAGGAIKYVWTNSPDPRGPYNTWTNAAHDIQSAVTNASTSDTIMVTDGVYYVTSHISIGSGKTIQSVNGAPYTFVVGTESNRCFYLNSGVGGAESVVDGFTITNGYHDSGLEFGNGGGGVCIYYGGIIKNCLIVGNTATGTTVVSEGGGGAYLCEGGTLSNCVIRGNMSFKHGGGVMAFGFGCVRTGTVQNCVMDGNTAEVRGGGMYGYAGHVIASTSRNNAAVSGGGIYIYGGGAIARCDIRNNYAAYDGGGIYFRNGSSPVGIGVYDSSILSNVCDEYGAGVYINGDDSGTLKNIVCNCLIAYNFATNDAYARGGGIYSDKRGRIENCTIVSNTAGTEGGGVRSYYGGTFTNTIIYRNRSITTGSSNYYNTGSDNSYNFSLMSPLIGGTSNLDENPLFVNGWRLGSLSPCVNTGTNQAWMTGATDLDGNNRIIASIVDRGCYEFNFVYATCAVYGVNGAIITNGEAAGAAKGTEFALIRINTAITNQLAITNDATTNLVIYGVSLSGSGAAQFGVDGFPMQVQPSSISNFNIVFAPSSAGTHTAVVEIACNITDSPYCLNLRGRSYEIIPSTGPAAGGNTVILTNGTLGNGSDITNFVFGSSSVTNITQGFNWACVTAPAHAAGTVDIKIYSTSEGLNTFTNSYRFNPPGQIDSCAPASGNVAGGTTATITGTNLGDGTDVTNVTLCAVAATNIVSQSITQVVVQTGASSVPGLGHVRVYSTSYGASVKSNAFTYTASEMAVLGTNGAVIASGEAAAAAKGTDLGSISWGIAVTNMLSITNSGNESLAISGWITNGAAAGHFRVANIPSVIAVNTKSNFNVIFSPSAGGMHTAAIAIANNSSNSSYIINIRGTGLPYDQTISFPQIADQVATGMVALSATAGSGLPVSFAVGSGPGEISGGATLTFSGAGSVSIVASQTGNANWNAAANVTNTFSVTKASQAITFPPIPDQAVTNQVNLAATASSGLAVSFSVVSGPGTISGVNILAFTGAGVVNVAASQAGNALWNAAPNVTNSVTVRDISTLATPQNLAASDGTYTDKVAVTWSAVSGAGDYQVWRATANNVGSAVNLGNSALPNYYDNSAAVRSATMFYYWVKAFNGVATSEFSAVDSGFCRSTENPAIISGQPMVGDYDGDCKADPAVSDLNNGRLFVWLSSAAYLLVTPVVTFQAVAGDLPVAGDFDGDRLADPGVFQRLTGSWYIWLSSAGYYRVGPLSFGMDLNDMPIPADYDGDGKADPAVCNAGLEWYVWLSSAGYYRVGPLTLFRVDASDIPAPGQFDADLLADPGVYQAASGNWYVWLSSAGYYRVGPITLGTTGDHLAVPADYDGDGLSDPAAYVPTNGVWRIWESGNGYALKELPLR